MKKIFTLIAIVVFSASVFAQSPEKMSYQAVLRDASNKLVTNISVGMQISILQGSATGTSVYVETQTSNTNANGLVSIEIGNGTLVSGDFTTIDWANGPYFIKTETDPTGGTNYTLSGISQLLSVPYALHAKTAENVTGTITETDPVFGLSVAGDITATDTTNWNNKLDAEVDGSVTNEIQTISRTGLTVTLSNGGGTFQDSVNVYTAGTGIDITNNVVSKSTYTVGDFAHGGIVFWVDETGQHGLIVATSDQSAGIMWYNGSSTTTNAVRDGVYAGMQNTERIIANQGVGSYAAQICANFQGSSYGDWYLPSKYELNLLYQQKDVIGGFSAFAYWSSTESDNVFAWFQSFFNGNQSTNGKIGTFYVRAIRTF